MALKANCKQSAFTALELLVVTAIIGMLLVVVLPATQSAREAARRAQCLANLKQLGIAALMHHEAYSHYPSSGWGPQWVGLPDRGTGIRQPGGWIYNILPFTEHENLHSLGRNQDGPSLEASNALRLSTPLALFACPTRRTAANWPVVANPLYPFLQRPMYSAVVSSVARSDYVANVGGDSAVVFSSPKTLAEGDSSFYWDKQINKKYKFSGVSYIRSQVNSALIRDGTSNTLMFGEKCLSSVHYFSGIDAGDNESMYTGFCSDIARGTKYPPLQDPERSASTDSLRFGSAHPGAFNVIFCDGSAKSIRYSIDPALWQRAGSRADGGVIETPLL